VKTISTLWAETKAGTAMQTSVNARNRMIMSISSLGLAWSTPD
jgi:hypothetical protein